MSVCYVGGTFDLFHPGHVNILRSAARYGNVVVSLNRDEFVTRYKRPPVMTLEERWAVVDACRYVSSVIVNDDDEDSTRAILGVKPNYLIHGSDWTGLPLYAQMGVTEAFLAKHQIVTVHPPYTPGISTSELIERCRASGS